MSSSSLFDQSSDCLNHENPLKQLHSLSTLPYNKTPSPPLLNTTPNINLSRFKSIDITQKAKKNIALQIRNQNNNSRLKNKRNQSLGTISHRDPLNPELSDLMKLGFTNKKDTEIDYIELNKEMVKDLKAKQFLNKMFGSKEKSSNLMTMEAINTSTHKMDMTLPVIQHKRNSSKKANFLEQWLDQALDPQDLSPSDAKELSLESPFLSTSFEQQLRQQPISTHLTTVKKYQVDKQYLRSQNIPTEIIDRLYNTLFIYTHGISNVFNELLSFVKSAPGEESKDQKIVATFWKCFVKLLQGCSSFQTSFQKVEEQYVGRIGEIKEILLSKENEFLKESERMSELIARLEKEKMEGLNNYNKLESEHRITVATLELTDHAFNEEVQLRLKFEEKINHIYSSYEELKIKYQSLMSTLEIRNEESFEKASEEFKLKQKIRQQQGQLLEIQDLLSKQKSKVKERQLEVNIKKQELLDLEMSLQLKGQRQKEQANVMEAQVQKNAMLKARCDQFQNRCKMQSYTLDGMKNKVKQQTQLLEQYRKMNQELHQKYNQACQKLVEFEAHKIYQSAEIARLNAELSIVKEQFSCIESQKNSLESKLTLTLEQLHQCQFEVQSKNSALEEISSTIQDLKAIKDKYERLWKIIQKEKIQVENERNKIKEKYQLEKQQFIGLKMLYESRQKHIKDIEAKHDKEKDLLKRKITGYNQIVTKKESLILTYQKNQEEKGDLLLKRSYRIQQLEKELTDQKTLQIRKEKQNASLKDQLKFMESEIRKLEATLKSRGSELEKKLTEFDMTHEELQSIKSLMSSISSEKNSSITNLTSLYEDYRILVNRKGQHIHPMLYEDLSQQFNRIKLEIIPRFQKQVKNLTEIKEKLEKDILFRDAVIFERNQEISKLNSEISEKNQIIEGKTSSISQLNQSILGFEKTIKTQSTQISKNEKTINDKEKSIAELQAFLQTSNEKISTLNSSLTAKQVEIDRLIYTVANLAEKLSKYQVQTQKKQKQNPYLIKIQKLDKELVQLRKQFLDVTKELKILKNIPKAEQQSQTEPEGQVAIYEPKSKFNESIRRNKFFVNDPSTKLQHKEVQVSLAPYDSIPQYIDSKISEIKREEVKKQEKTEMAFSVNPQLKSKSKESPENANKLTSEKSVTKLEPKEPISRRQELRRALRFTYMKR